EDGFDLWLRYRPVEAGQALTEYRSRATQIVTETRSPTLQAAAKELSTGPAGLLGAPGSVSRSVTRHGAVLIGTPASSGAIKALGFDLSRVGKEGYVISSTTVAGHPVIAIVANEDVGVLYGVFHFLRLMQTRASLDSLPVVSAPMLER